MKLGVLCSGNLGFQILEKLMLEYTIVFIATDKNSTPIISFCELNDYPIFVGNPRNGKLLDNFNSLEIDVLISVNYLYLIEKDLINLPKLLAFNIHGSLLPKYRGRTPHVWAIINGEKECGITAHIINEDCDDGDLLLQKIIKIEESDTGASILEKFSTEYYPIIKSVLNDIENNCLKRINQDKSKISYFGKRTPEDGRINWEWSKERIYNWVRAQSFPYPGAYTFYNNQKVIIDWIEYNDLGFHQLDQNGRIMCVEKNIPFVKTSNGVIKLSKIRELNKLEFQIDKILK